MWVPGSWPEWYIVACIASVATAVFVSALPGTLSYDDPHAVTDNPVVTGELPYVYVPSNHPMINTIVQRV